MFIGIGYENVPQFNEDQMLESFVSTMREWLNRDPKIMPFSNPEAIVEHPAFKAVVCQGNYIIPFLLKDLQKSKEIYWAIALDTLVLEKPFPEEHRGHVSKIRNAWIAWGLKNGYIDA